MMWSWNHNARYEHADALDSNFGLIEREEGQRRSSFFELSTAL
jgi:hypothetical protein